MLNPCPCHSQQPYNHCCQPYHDGQLPATPTALMRSRYAAYALGRVSYILNSEYPPLPPAARTAHRASIRQFCQTVTFIGLEILDASPIVANQATVTFHATLLQNGRDGSYTETSSFVRKNGRWFYLPPPNHHTRAH